MGRSENMDSMLNGFFRGGAWGALAVLFVVAVEVAPLILR